MRYGGHKNSLCILWLKMPRRWLTIAHTQPLSDAGCRFVCLPSPYASTIKSVALNLLLLMAICLHIFCCVFSPHQPCTLSTSTWTSKQEQTLLTFFCKKAAHWRLLLEGHTSFQNSWEGCVRKRGRMVKWKIRFTESRATSMRCLIQVLKKLKMDLNHADRTEIMISINVNEWLLSFVMCVNWNHCKVKDSTTEYSVYKETMELLLLLHE